MTRGPLPPFELGSAEFESLCQRVREGTASAEDQDTFTARVLEQYCRRIYAGVPPPHWIQLYIANALFKVINGGRWEDELPLPWTQRTSLRTPAEQKGLEIYCDVENALRTEPAKGVTATVRSVAKLHSVSFELARQRYYEWKSRLSESGTSDSE